MLSFEKCIYHQLCKSFDVLLVSRQSAFRKHHGCDTALKVKFNLDSKRFVGVVSLDLRKTFDSLHLTFSWLNLLLMDSRLRVLV